MVKVAVIGAAGYLGSQTCGDLLRRGYQVVAIDKLLYSNARSIFHLLGHPNFEFYREDIRNTEAIRKLISACDVVGVLAAIVGQPACASNPKYAEEVNYFAVRDLMHHISPAQRVISFCTNSGYGETDGNRFCTEDDGLTPISLYAVSKVEAEKCVLKHRNAVSLRLATVFGVSPRPRLDLLVNDFTVRLMKIKYEGGQLKLFEPHFYRNFVGVRDVSSAFQHMIENPWTGVFNCGLPTANLTKMQLAHTICDVIGVSKNSVVESDGRDPDRRNYLVSNEKLLRTGFQFKHGLEQGIREIANLYKLTTEAERAVMNNVANVG